MPYATTGKTGDELAVVLVSGEDEMTVDMITPERSRYLAIKLIEMAQKIDAALDERANAVSSIAEKSFGKRVTDRQ
jgi:hypothetical protein